MAVRTDLNEHVNIMYSFNEIYAPICGVSLTSLFENNQHLKEITVYLVMDNVSDKNKERFYELGKRYNREIIIIDAKPWVEEARRVGLKPYRNIYVTNMKLFFENFVKPDVEMLIYFDCDTLIVGKIDRYLEFDYSGKCIAMSRDLMHEYRALSMKEIYFNCGSAVFNVKEWVEGEWTKKIIDYSNKVKSRFATNEEALLNNVCGDHILNLPMKFNFEAVHRAIPDESFFKVLPFPQAVSDDIKEAHRDPILLHTHVILGMTPWSKGTIHPDKEVFNKYLNISPWADYERSAAPNSMVTKIERVLYKYAPKSLFFRVFCVAQRRLHRKKQRVLDEEEALERSQIKQNNK